MRNVLPLPLLEYLQHKASCAYLDGLKYLNRWEKVQLTQAQPEQTAEAARVRLITALSQPVVKN